MTNLTQALTQAAEEHRDGLVDGALSLVAYHKFIAGGHAGMKLAALAAFEKLLKEVGE